MCPYVSLAVFFFNAELQSFVQTSMRFFLEHLEAEFSKKYIEQELIEHYNWSAHTANPCFLYRYQRGCFH